MTPLQQFSLCYLLASQVVSSYRESAPAGVDPVNSYVALAGVVVSAGTAAYSAYSENKKSKEAQKAVGAQQAPAGVKEMPPYIPVNIYDLNTTADAVDRSAYRASDQDFNKRRPSIVKAENLFEQQVLKDQQGESELMPAIQNEFMRAGITGSLSAFGDTPGTLAPGSAGEANVARNLGTSIVGFQDRNRENRTRSLLTAEQIFPRRTFGISGGDAANIEVANNAAQNNWNQANFAQQTQQGNIAANAAMTQNNINASADATAKAEQQKALISAANMAVQLGATYAGSRPKTTTPSASSAARPNTTGWAAGPQPGTYYDPLKRAA